MTDLPAVAGVARAYANWGRWVADCPHPYCDSALGVALGEAVFRCRECDTAADLVWPANVWDIATVLAMRPHPKTRNWVPGETLEDLVLENLAHGVVPPAWLTLGGGPRLVLTNDRITTGRLPAVPRALAIEA